MKTQPQVLVAMTKAHNALQEASSIDDLQRLRDQAEIARGYAKKLELGKSIIVQAAVLKLRAERKLGEILDATPLARASQGNQHPTDNNGLDRSHDATAVSGLTLKELGVSKWDSSRCQQIARYPEDKFEEYIQDSIDTEKEPTTAALLRLAKQYAAVESSKQRPRSTGYVLSLEDLLMEKTLFGTILVDPPWSYANSVSNGAAENHYPTMSFGELKELPVAELAEEQAHLFLWTTTSFLREGLELIEAWGFNYKSNFIWIKENFGCGQYFRVSHELVLFGNRGMCPQHELMLFANQGGAPFHANDVLSYGEYPARGHSVKPDEVRSMIETISPGPYLEMFARQQREGWTAYGNQLV